MTEVVIDDTLAQTIAQAAGPIQLRDRLGRYVGRLIRDEITPADIAAAKRRLASDQPRYSTAEVLAHLDALGRQRTRFAWYGCTKRASN
jgi:hypothetical protein